MTLDQHGALTLQDLPWTPELEEYLLHERPTQMDNRASERERFANLLSNNLKTIESQFCTDLPRLSWSKSWVSTLNTTWDTYSPRLRCIHQTAAALAIVSVGCSSSMRSWSYRTLQY